MGAAAVFALACATPRDYDGTPEALRREVAERVEELGPSDVVVPFEVDAPEVARARDLIRGADAEHRVDALVSAIQDPQGFGLRYEWATSGTASETIARGAGNCLALSSTLVGLARGLGMEARYLEVILDDPSWRTDGDVAVQADHVAAVIASGSQRLYVDFSGRLQRARKIRRIDDFAALAHFYNNRGYELLHRAAGQPEPDWALAAADFALATRIDPANARAWNNLGVARARQGDDAGARVAYETALANDARSQSAHLNLVSLFLRSGELERAAEHLEAARRLDPRNPQIERLAVSLPRAESQQP
jgi:tetratricopeptide (TPR) repeat protein